MPKNHFGSRLVQKEQDINNSETSQFFNIKVDDRIGDMKLFHKSEIEIGVFCWRSRTGNGLERVALRSD